MVSKILRLIKKHKIITAVIILVVIGISYSIIRNASGVKTETRYILGIVEKGTLISSVAGSGQVSASNQTEIKPRTSGEITGIYVTVGQEVKTGALIAQLDTRDAARAVRDAETNLETARLELDKLLEPADELTVLQAEISLLQARNSKTKAEYNLEKSYEDGFNTVSTAFLNLPTIMAELEDMFFTSTIELVYLNFDWYSNQINRWDTDVLIYKEDALAKYTKAKAEHKLNFSNYKQTTRDFSSDEIISLVSETYNTTRSIAEAIKSFKNYTDYVKTILVEKGIRISTIISTHQASLDSSTQKVNSYLTSLLSARQSIKDCQQAVLDAETSIKEKELSHAKTIGSPDELTVRAKRIAIQQKEDALSAARQTLVDCYVRAAFDGVIVKVNTKKGETVSSGSSIATLVTKQQIAEISLNEVDAAKIKVGQKSTFTFDAVDELTITGEVSEVDVLGSVSQGVVTYSVKIAFDTQDDRVKPGMSTSVTIITEAKQNVLLVNNSSIKTSNNTYYVETFDNLTTLPSGATTPGITSNILPQRVIVETGLSNDSSTEIISGLEEGDIIIVRTVSSSSQSSGGSAGSSTRGLFQMQGIMPK